MCWPSRFGKQLIRYRRILLPADDAPIT